jgi:dTDP-glucose pyrophosphorylase
MIQWVIENVRPKQLHRFTFICLEEHLTTYPDVPATLNRLCPGCNIVKVNKVTEGAACTVLLAKQFINNDEPLMIVNADQYVELDVNSYLEKMESESADGIIMTFWSDHPKWSYCKMNQDGTVAQVVEKKVVSNEATVGIYNFKSGRDFVIAAELMIEKNLRVNGEFYVAPVYDQLIAGGAKVVICDTGREYNGMYGLGTPDDLGFFNTTSIFNNHKAASSPCSIDLEKERLRFFVLFLNTRNLAGVRAFLSENCSCSDSSKFISGRGSVVDYIFNIAQSTEGLFSVNNFYDSKPNIGTYIKMTTGHLLQSSDIILEWDNGRIVSLKFI